MYSMLNTGVVSQHSLNVLLDGEGKHQVNLSQKYFIHLSKWLAEQGWCNFVLLFITLKYRPIEATPVALEQTFLQISFKCFRAIKRNYLYLFSPLLIALLVKLQAVSTMVQFFLLGMCWTDDKGAVCISSRICVSFQTSFPCICIFCQSAYAHNSCTGTEYPVVLRP